MGQARLDRPKWILDGDHTRTVPIKWQNVELVIWLDYPFLLTLRQAIFRAWKRSWKQEELWEGTGNRESFRKSFFSKDSIIWWMIKTHQKVRIKYISYMNDPEFSHIRFIRLRSRSPSEAEKFIEDFKQQRFIDDKY